MLIGMAQDPAWLESRYVDGWGVWVAQGLSKLSGKAGFSVGEVLIGALAAVELWWLLDGVAEVLARRLPTSRAILGGLAHVGDVAAVLAVWFYLSWGLNYARQPALIRQGWEEPPAPAELEGRLLLHAWAEAAVNRSNEAYRALHRGAEDAGVVTLPASDAEVDAALERGFAASGRALQLPASFSAGRGRAKVVWASELMSWAGIGGIYLPFTGEANVNGGPPAWSRVMTVAHEKAHQRMVASEDEATFYGFLAGVHAEEPLLRYAAWELASRHLLRTLSAVDEDAAKQLSARRLPGVVRDQTAVRDHWLAYEGKFEEVATWMNDHYLRAHRVEGGVAAYGRAGRLIAAWLRTEDGRRQIGPLTLPKLPPEVFVGPPAPAGAP